MTIEAWNLVLNAVVAVLVVAYGVWLKYIVTQQRNAFEAVIKIKDAEISALKADTAPAIVKAYSEMREHADKMTADVRRLSEQLKKATEEAQDRAVANISALQDVWNSALNEQLRLFWINNQSKMKQSE